MRRIEIFRIIADRYRYPGATHSEKFAIVAGIANMAAGF
jgi:hypothetical protein